MVVLHYSFHVAQHISAVSSMVSSYDIHASPLSVSRGQFKKLEQLPKHSFATCGALLDLDV